MIYRAASGFTGTLFEVQSGSLHNCTVSGQGSGYGVLVTGNDTTVEAVTVEGCLYGVQAQHCQRVTIRRCIARWNRQYGFNAEYADSITFDHCEGAYNGLDGLKLRAKATAITISNGHFHHNGQQFPASAGDGIDIFAGGNGVLIEDCVLEYNKGYGLVLKTDTLTRDDPLTYGIPGNVTVRRCKAQHNLIWGIIITSGAEASIPLFRGATVQDTISTDNGYGGLWINAGDVIVDGLIAAPNQVTVDVNVPSVEGVLIDTRSENVALSNVTGAVVDLRP